MVSQVCIPTRERGNEGERGGILGDQTLGSVAYMAWVQVSGIASAVFDFVSLVKLTAFISSISSYKYLKFGSHPKHTTGVALAWVC